MSATYDEKNGLRVGIADTIHCKVCVYETMYSLHSAVGDWKCPACGSKYVVKPCLRMEVAR